ncbi:CCA tRNA nucleotidyltransferase [Sphingomonas morindae]|uniref:CCA tRNA nucleotidyltransferase n=1 Tax=Sphingomonas morindae TaxID=1541170 RepID=A0ABY4X6T1_9SPHN|nr:CCA tRNA nucleotidyltransferase [Sphingomonas morindae]USI72628.1 CCA tRNA nucleotidyltransferase [Sphingomonas morindae]
MAETRLALPPANADPEGLLRLVEALEGARDGARFIGGWVRDRLLGFDAADLDIATRLHPDQARLRAEQAGLAVWTSASGLAHGTIGVVVGGQTIEVTTLRRDVATDGRHAAVAFTEDWRLDAARRDFTINALSADPLSGLVHDYFDGLADLAARRVRFIGDPRTRIAEDHLRILRFYRFQARFGGAEPDPPSHAACVSRARDLMSLSRERIAAELLKILALPDPLAVVRLMIADGLFAAVVPEIGEAGRLAALLESERAAAFPPRALRRLAALLPADPARAEQVAARLKLSRAERRHLALLADPADPRDGVALAYASDAAIAIDRLLLAGRPDAALRLEGWQRPRFPVSGGALIARGLTPGPVVARTLQAIEARWIAEGFPAGPRLAALVDAALAAAL